MVVSEFRGPHKGREGAGVGEAWVSGWVLLATRRAETGRVGRKVTVRARTLAVSHYTSPMNYSAFSESFYAPSGAR
jgi:hypothetical protein